MGACAAVCAAKAAPAETLRETLAAMRRSRDSGCKGAWLMLSERVEWRRHASLQAGCG